MATPSTYSATHLNVLPETRSIKAQLKQNKNTLKELKELIKKNKSHTVGSNSVNFNHTYRATIERLEKKNKELKQQIKENPLMGGTRSRTSKRSRSKRSRTSKRTRKHKKYKN